MTTEEKAKAYDEALDKMKHVVIVPKNEKALQALKETIFPELRESEDERIRKEMITYFTEIKSTVPIGSPNHFDRYIAYLERQKEQKPRWEINNPHTTKWTREMIDEKFEELVEQEPVKYRVAVEPTPKQNYSGYSHCWRMAEKQNYSSLTDFEQAIHRGFLCSGVMNVPVTIIKETAQECMAKIKPAEWSEEEKMKSYIGLALTDVNEQRFKDFGTTLKDCLDWLNRPSWKPSKEQMKALNRVANNGLLLDLFNDLLKLKQP